jgi:hypothetical protein
MCFCPRSLGLLAAFSKILAQSRHDQPRFGRHAGFFLLWPEPVHGAETPRPAIDACRNGGSFSLAACGARPVIAGGSVAIFAAYKPRPGQSVLNLLSEGIIKEDGTPGPLRCIRRDAPFRTRLDNNGQRWARRLNYSAAFDPERTFNEFTSGYIECPEHAKAVVTSGLRDRRR